MTRHARWHVPAPVAAALVGLVLTGCQPISTSHYAGPGMTTHMGQGSIRCSTTAPRVGARVDVVLMDMRHRAMMRGTGDGWMTGPRHTGSGMMHGRMMLRSGPRVVRAGQVTFAAANHGTRLHELVVLPLGPHASIGRRTVGPDRAVDETASLGEASASCAAGEGDGIEPGSLGWVTLRLTPGRYELVCNRPGHYGDGMYAELVVR
jgi:uncharacterized cupredoxin-like copper-binding protein